jgi:hypothetical protein
MNRNLLRKLANVLGKSSVYLRDADALLSGDIKIIGQRVVNRFISSRNRNMYLGGRKKS